jgi:hypothetical protein
VIKVLTSLFFESFGHGSDQLDESSIDNLVEKLSNYDKIALKVAETHLVSPISGAFFHENVFELAKKDIITNIHQITRLVRVPGGPITIR